MIDAATRYKHAVVIGGGLLGLEAANGLMLRGMDVTVVHLAPWLMERQLDERGRQAAAEIARSARPDLPDRRADRSAGRRRERPRDGDPLQGRQRSAGRSGRDGRRHPPQHGAGRDDAACTCNRGIVVNDTMQTITDPRIYAVGECAAHRGIAYGLVAPLFEQAKVLRHAPGRVRHRPLPGLADLDQAQGHRHRPVLGRQLHRRRQTPKRS